MAQILFIKTSSLGDVIHHMPAMSESRVHHPQARISWLVEESYVPLAKLHPAVDEVIPLASRRWRNALFKPSTFAEIGRLRRVLKARRYDTIVDTQGLVRSAILTRAASGLRHGYDRDSIREPLASRLYDVGHAVSRKLHAIERNRRLTGLALGYAPQGEPHYGLDRAQLREGSERYALFLHGSARREKEWPVANWIALGLALQRRFDAPIVVPWGNDDERVRAGQIVAALPQARLADRLAIDAMARLVAGADFVVGGDTGLVHLAAALGVPLVAMFIATEPGLTRPIGAGPIAVVGGTGTMPSVEDVGHALKDVAP